MSHKGFSKASLVRWFTFLLTSSIGLLGQSAVAQLVAHWDLEEGTGLTTTAAVGSPLADGDLLGATTWDTQFLPPVVGGTTANVTFDQDPDSIGTLFGDPNNLPTTLPLGNSARTFAAWVRVDPIQPGFATILSYGDNNTAERSTFRVNTTAASGNVGALRFEIQGDFVVGNAIVADGQWHHVAVAVPDNDPDGDLAVDLDDVSFYVNGVLDADRNIGFSGSGADPSLALNSTITQGAEVTLGSINSQGDSRSLRGALDDVRIYDTALTPGAIAALAPTAAGQLGVTIDRQTGATTLANSTANSISFVGYTLSSSDGALDASGWTSIADSDPVNWFELPASTEQLSEQEQPGGSGITITSASSDIDLGQLWIQNDVEDVYLTLLANDGSTLSIPAMFTGTAIEDGDYDFDGDVDAVDWGIFRTNLFTDISSLSPAQQFQAGDINNDGLSNELDFLAFKTIFDANQGQGAFAALNSSNVPEPSSIVIAGLALTYLLYNKRKHLAMSNRAFQFLGFVAFCSLLLTTNTAHAQLLTWDAGGDGVSTFQEANWVVTDNTGQPTWTIGSDPPDGTVNPATDVPANAIVGGAATAGGVNGAGGSFELADGFGLTVQDTATFRMAAGIGMRGFSAGSPGALNLSGDTEVLTQFLQFFDMTMAGTSDLTLFGGGNPVNETTIDLDASWEGRIVFNAETTDAVIAEHLSKITVGGSPAVVDSNISLISDGGAGSILSLFTPPQELSLEVNTDTGLVTILNSSAGPVDFNFYKLTSATDSLDVNSWNSLEDQDLAGFPAGTGVGDGWEEAGGSNDGELGEAYLTGSSALAVGQEINLGSVFRQGTGTEDIALRYFDMELGAFVDIDATYVTGGVLGGDYNSDGTVDLADYTIWRNNLGDSVTLPGENPGAGTPGVVDEEDYTYWRSQFGNSLNPLAGSASNVPEPPSWALIGIGLGLLVAGKFGWRFQKLGATKWLACCAFSLFSAANCSLAETRIDRNYQLGDDPFEQATAGITVGTGRVDEFAGLSFDAAGSPGNGSFVDLEVLGAPVYTNVNSLGRPQSSSGDLGVSFGGNDILVAARLNAPNSSASASSQTGRFNYAGIVDRGYQFWARPTSGVTAAQSVVDDAGQHAVRITDTGTWELRYGGSDFDSQVPVSFNAWSHVMLVRPFGIEGGARLYVDGEVVVTAPGGYTGAQDWALVLGGASNDTVSSGSPTTTDYYTGIIDDLEMFLMGVTSARDTLAVNELGQFVDLSGTPVADQVNGTGAAPGRYLDYGTFDPATDNAFIANALAGLTPGDLTGDGSVSGDGTGPASTDDVSAFIANWNTVYTVGEIQVGDLMSRDLGDFNLDGIVDIEDWSILRSNHANAATLNLGALLASSQVPEPSSFLLIGVGLGATACVCRRRS